MDKPLSTDNKRAEKLLGVMNYCVRFNHLRIFFRASAGSLRLPDLYVTRALRSADRGNRSGAWRGIALVATLLWVMLPAVSAYGDSFTENPPVWEPLLWGGKVTSDRSMPTPSDKAEDVDGIAGIRGSTPTDSARAGEIDRLGEDRPTQAKSTDPNSVFRTSGLSGPVFASACSPPALVLPGIEFPRMLCREPFRSLALNNMPPLYVTPELPGEGIWESSGMPSVSDGWPVLYKTSYRPSEKYPNAIVHMIMLDMKYLSMRLYIGSGEPNRPANASMIEPENRSRLVAITNGLWKQKHSRDAGAIFRGKILREMVPGMATIVLYKDGFVDILEWNDSIPVDKVSDARQLRHLIVKDGRVVRTINSGGKVVDAEIGLGFLLSEDQRGPQGSFWGSYPYGYGRPYGYGNPYGYGGQAGGINYSDEWFIATRSAFGIRKDGNLVFAIGHHISTKDLAKALVLAGCERAIHGDANPHNVVGNLYYRNPDGDIVQVSKLSPDQKDYTLKRYLDRSYTSDFFGFFSKLRQNDNT
jgi:hypothetical protein